MQTPQTNQTVKQFTLKTKILIFVKIGLLHPSSSSRSPLLPPPPPHCAPLCAATTAPGAWGCCAEDLATTLHCRCRRSSSSAIIGGRGPRLPPLPPSAQSSSSSSCSSFPTTESDTSMGDDT